MSVPRRRLSKARTHKRKAGATKSHSVKLDKCNECGKDKKCHRMCAACGFYK